MKKDVIISIKGTQQVEKSFDKIEFITNGVFEIKPDRYLIKYDECPSMGMEDTKTILEVQRGSMVMTREGRINSRMMFEPLKKHICHYDTSLGIMNMGISTKRLRTNLDKTGGNLYVKYSIDINDTHAGDNTLEITLKEANHENGKHDKIS